MAAGAGSCGQPLRTRGVPWRAASVSTRTRHTLQEVAEVLPFGMEIIPQKMLRNQVGEVLRRVEAGETLVVSVAGRPVAELSPVARRRWVGGATLAQVWQGPAPQTLEADLRDLDATIADPFES